MPLKARSTTGRVWPEQVSGVCLIAMAAASRAIRRGSRGSSGLFSPPWHRLRLLKAPALTLGLSRETGKGQSGGPEVRKGLGTGQGVCDGRPTAVEGGKGREGGE